MCLFRHWVTNSTQSDAILKHKHRYVSSGLPVGRLKGERVYHTENRTCVSARVQSVEFVISRALPLFCSGSLSGNQTSFSASRPCWNSVTEINVYRVFLVSNLMVFCFVLFCLRPSPFFSFSVECVSWFWVKKKSLKKITRSLRIGGLKPQHHGSFHLIAPPPLWIRWVDFYPPKNKRSKVTAHSPL